MENGHRKKSDVLGTLNHSNDIKYNNNNNKQETYTHHQKNGCTKSCTEERMNQMDLNKDGPYHCTRLTQQPRLQLFNEQ